MSWQQLLGAALTLGGAAGIDHLRGSGYTGGQKRLHHAQADIAEEMNEAYKRRDAIEQQYLAPAMEMIFGHVGGAMNMQPRALYAPGIFTPDMSGRQGQPVEMPDPIALPPPPPPPPDPAPMPRDVDEWDGSGAPRYTPRINVPTTIPQLPWNTDFDEVVSDAWIAGTNEESIIDRFTNWASELGIADVAEWARDVAQGVIRRADNEVPFDPYPDYDFPGYGNIRLGGQGQYAEPHGGTDYQTRLDFGPEGERAYGRPSLGPEGRVGMSLDDVLAMYRRQAQGRNIATDIGISGGEEQIFNRREGETQRYNDAAVASGAARLVSPDEYARIRERGSLGSFDIGTLNDRFGNPITDENGNIYIIPHAWAGPSGISFNLPEWFSGKDFQWPAWLDAIASGQELSEEEYEALLNQSTGYANAPYTGKPPGWTENYEAVQRYHEESRPEAYLPGPVQAILDAFGFGAPKRHSIDDVIDYIRYDEGEGTPEGRRELWDTRQDERGLNRGPTGTRREQGLVSNQQMEDEFYQVLANALTTTPSRPSYEEVHGRPGPSLIEGSPGRAVSAGAGALNVPSMEVRPRGDDLRRRIKSGDWYVDEFMGIRDSSTDQLLWDASVGHQYSEVNLAGGKRPENRYNRVGKV
jgi:hypothetical protein